MFLKKTIERNRALIDFAIKANNEGKIFPNSYLIDLDSVVENTRLLVTEASKHNIQLFQMTKQFGRNPIIAKAISDAGIEKAVCVDYEEALTMDSFGIKLGNVGHLVQTPKHIIERIVKLKPEVMTIFSIEKATEISVAAKKNNLIQDIIIRVYDDNDIIYDGQNGGIKLELLKETLNKIKELENIKVVGFTSFPIFLFDGESTKSTNNLKTINKAISISKELGIDVKHINLPSANSTETIKYIKEYGGTHGEPGHALTGTMPVNSIKNLSETPSIVYVSEISHICENKAYFFAGGFYRRGHFDNILVSNKQEKIFKMNEFPHDSIDYYMNFNHENDVAIGDTVVAAFRTQIFVTRSKVVVVKGLSTGNPTIVGQHSSQGEELPWK